MFGYIYKTTNLVNGKIYVGKKHCSEFVSTYYGSGRHIRQAIAELGVENFRVEVLDWGVDLPHLNLLERWWIKKLDVRNRAVGYNISPGGNSYSMTEGHSEETKQKISASMKELLKNGDYRRKGDMRKSEETKNKLREALLGHSVSEETRKKIGEKSRGRKPSDETRRKLRSLFLGVPRGDSFSQKLKQIWRRRRLMGYVSPLSRRIIMLDDSKNVVKEFDSAHEVARCFGKTIGGDFYRAIGTDKKRWGFYWRYKD